MARPTKYQEAYAEQARKLCLLGYTDAELADFFEVSESTINKWKLDYPKFSESIKKGKAVADAEVSDRLYQRAMGFVAPDIDIRVIENRIVEIRLRSITRL
ncbi:terminase, partial [Escherichia coli]